jgi:hypothetical protein
MVTANFCATMHAQLQLLIKLHTCASRQLGSFPQSTTLCPQSLRIQPDEGAVQASMSWHLKVYQKFFGPRLTSVTTKAQMASINERETIVDDSTAVPSKRSKTGHTIYLAVPSGVPAVAEWQERSEQAAPVDPSHRACTCHRTCLSIGASQSRACSWRSERALRRRMQGLRSWELNCTH